MFHTLAAIPAGSFSREASRYRRNCSRTTVFRFLISSSFLEDTGPGVPDEVLERLCYGFPPEGVKLRFSGAGLGLAIVRTLVEAMGGSLSVDTGAEGTRFSFVLSLPMTQ